MYTPRLHPTRQSSSPYLSPSAETQRTTETKFRSTLRSARMSPYNTFYQLSTTQPTQRTIDCQNCQKCQHLKRMEQLEKACKKYDLNYLKSKGGAIDIQNNGLIINKSNNQLQKNRQKMHSSEGFGLYSNNYYPNFNKNQHTNINKTAPKQNFISSQKRSTDRFVYDFKTNEGNGSGYPIQTFTLYEYQSPQNTNPIKYNPHYPINNQFEQNKLFEHPEYTAERFNMLQPQSPKGRLISNHKPMSQYQDLVNKIAFVKSTQDENLADNIRDIIKSQRIHEISEARNDQLKGIVQNLVEKQNNVQKRIDNFMNRMDKQKQSVFQRNVKDQLQQFKERENNIIKEFEKLRSKQDQNKIQRLIEKQFERQKDRFRDNEQYAYRSANQLRDRQNQRLTQAEILRNRLKQIQSQTIRENHHISHNQNQIIKGKQLTQQTEEIIQKQIQLQLQKQRENLQQKQIQWNRQLEIQKQQQQKKIIQLENQKQRVNQIEAQRQRQYQNRIGIDKQRENQILRQREIQIRSQMMRGIEAERQKWRQQQIVREQERRVAEVRQRQLIQQIQRERQTRNHNHQNSSLIDLSSDPQDNQQSRSRRQQHSPNQHQTIVRPGQHQTHVTSQFQQQHYRTNIPGQVNIIPGHPNIQPYLNPHLHHTHQSHSQSQHISQHSQHTQSNPMTKRIYEDVEEWKQVSFQSNNSLQFKRRINSLFNQAQQYNNYLQNYRHLSNEHNQLQKVDSLIRLKNESVNQGTAYLNQLNHLIRNAEIPPQIPLIHSRVSYERQIRQL